MTTSQQIDHQGFSQSQPQQQQQQLYQQQPAEVSAQYFVPAELPVFQQQQQPQQQTYSQYQPAEAVAQPYAQSVPQQQQQQQQQPVRKSVIELFSATVGGSDAGPMCCTRVVSCSAAAGNSSSVRPASGLSSTTDPADGSAAHRTGCLHSSSSCPAFNLAGAGPDVVHPADGCTAGYGSYY